MADQLIFVFCCLLAAFGVFVLIAALAARLTRNTKLLRVVGAMLIRGLDGSEMDDAEFLRRYFVAVLLIGAGLTAVGILFILWWITGFRMFHF